MNNEAKKILEEKRKNADKFEGVKKEFSALMSKVDERTKEYGNLMRALSDTFNKEVKDELHKSFDEVGYTITGGNENSLMAKYGDDIYELTIEPFRGKLVSKVSGNNFTKTWGYTFDSVIDQRGFFKTGNIGEIESAIMLLQIQYSNLESAISKIKEIKSDNVAIQGLEINDDLPGANQRGMGMRSSMRGPSQENKKIKHLDSLSKLIEWLVS